MNVTTRGTVCAQALLVLALLCLPLAGFAQDQSAGAFPFVSIDPSQLRSLKSAFLLQWKLLRGFGDVSALYYIALAAALVGALSIIFVKKCQEIQTIVAWFLTVVICLFAPYNSKLLFYPTVLKSDPEGLAVSADNACDTSGTFVACGFTPQLVAAHIGTTLQVIFADLFKSVEFKGLVDGAIAGAALTNAMTLKTSGSWLGDVNEYQATCPAAKILPAELTPNDEGQGITPYTLASAFDRVTAHYGTTARSGVEADFRTAPPAVTLDWQANRNNASYAAAVGSLCDVVVAGNTGSAAQFEQCGSNGNPDRAQKATETLLNLAKTVNANPDPNSVLFYLTGPKNNGIDSGADAARQSIATCFTSSRDPVNKTAGTLWNEFKGRVPCSTYWDKAGWAYGAFPKKGDGAAGAHVNAEMTPAMLALLRGFDRAPVSVREYPTASKPVDTAGKCSTTRGNELFEALFENGLVDRDAVWTQENMSKAMLARLRDKVRGAPLPTTWTLNDITDDVDCGAWFFKKTGQDKVCKTANDFLSVLNSEQFFDGALSDADKRLRIANLVVGAVMPSTAIHSQSEASREAAANTGMRPSVVGDVHNSPIPMSQQTTGGVLGKVIEVLGGGIAHIMAQFVGPFSIAVLQFCRVIIDMVLIGVIVITPFILLFGIAMPVHAAGILIQVIAVVAILKFVPVTFLIVDNMAGIVYRTFSVIGGDDPKLKEAIFIFAVAGIYTHIVGITLFMLFKIGSVQNLESLRQIDSGAEKLADAGKKAAIALGSMLGTVALGGAIGGFGTLSAGKGAKAAMKSAGQAAFDNATDHLPNSVKGAAEEFNKGKQFGDEDPPPDAPLHPNAPIDPNGPVTPTEGGEAISLANWQAAQRQWSYRHGGAAPSTASDWQEINDLALQRDQGGRSVSPAALSRINMDNTKKQYILEVFQNAGVDDVTLDQIRMML